MANKAAEYWNQGENPFLRDDSATAPAQGSHPEFNGTAYVNSTDRIAQVTLSSAQVLALNATPVSVIAAPGAGYVNIIDKVTASKAAGTAYADIAAGEDIALRYTNGSGSIAATLEATGFLDSTSATISHATGAACLPVANAAIVAHMTSGEVTTGNSPVLLEIHYRTMPVPLFS